MSNWLSATPTNCGDLNGDGIDDILIKLTFNTTIGGAGDDVIHGNGGADVMYGGAGNDSFNLTKNNIDQLTRGVSSSGRLARVDGGGGNQDPILYRDSQLIYTAKTSGHYFIDASSNLERSSGAYTLSYKVI